MKKLITENGIKITAKKKFTVNFFPEPIQKTKQLFFSSKATKKLNYKKMEKTK